MGPNLNLMMRALMCLKEEHLLVSHLTSARLFSEHDNRLLVDRRGCRFDSGLRRYVLFVQGS
jgi:hypothetical protein